jgi:APA family basic amino acid/polyamine antiporter
MASMIGAGILVTSGYTLQATGNPAALVGLWVVGGVMALCGAATVAELATTVPQAGGDYLFVREAFGGLIYVGYAYSGWNGAGYLAGELREPSKFLPRALLGGTVCVVLLYLLVNVAYVYALDPAAMTTRSPAEVEKVAELAVGNLFGPAAANLFAVLIGLSLVASVSAYVLTGARVTFAMARDGCFPALAGGLHTSRGIPVRATVIQGGVAAGLSLPAGENAPAAKSVWLRRRQLVHCRE